MGKEVACNAYFVAQTSMLSMTSRDAWSVKELLKVWWRCLLKEWFWMFTRAFTMLFRVWYITYKTITTYRNIWITKCLFEIYYGALMLFLLVYTTLFIYAKYEYFIPTNNTEIIIKKLASNLLFGSLLLETPRSFSPILDTVVKITLSTSMFMVKKNMCIRPEFSKSWKNCNRLYKKVYFTDQKRPGTYNRKKCIIFEWIGQ